MKKVLPFDYTNEMNGECSSYARFSIMLTKPEITLPWIGTKVDFHMGLKDNRYGADYGRIGTIIQLEDWDEILDQYPISMMDTKEEDLVNIIKNEIDKDRYIIIYVNPEILYGSPYPFGQENRHEYLIYGYDDEKQCFYVPLLGAKKIFEETHIPYKRMVHAYSILKKAVEQNGDLLYERKFYFYEITSLKVRETYECPNFVFAHLRKIEREKIGQKLVVTEGADYVYDRMKWNKTNYVSYTGISIWDNIKQIFDIFEKQLSGQEDDSEFDKNVSSLIDALKDFYDYKTISGRQMDYCLDLTGARHHKRQTELLIDYWKNVHAIKMFYLLVIKLRKTKDLNCLNQLKEMLNKISCKDEVTLSQYAICLTPFDLQSHKLKRVGMDLDNLPVIPQKSY